MAQSRRNRPASRADDNSRSVNGAHTACFGEAFGCAFVVSGPSDALEGLTVIGRVGGDRLCVTAGSVELQAEISDICAAWEAGLSQLT